MTSPSDNIRKSQREKEKIKQKYFNISLQYLSLHQDYKTENMMPTSL